MYKERGNACLEDLQKSSPLPVFLPCFAGAFNLGGYASINILLWLWHESQEAGKDAVETCLTLQMLPLISISCVFLLHPTHYFSYYFSWAALFLSLLLCDWI